MNAPPPSPLSFSFPIPKPRTRRGRIIAKWFSLTFPKNKNLYCDPIKNNDYRALLPAPGEIVLVTGPSGAGKSSLLRLLQKTERIDWIDLGKILPPNRPLVDCFGTLSLEEVLALLARVGLAEAWTYLRTPSQLSDGQRWRLKLALALSQAKTQREPILIADEFAALLDRVTAAVVARSLRRAISADKNCRAILATSHDDLTEALAPDVYIRCDFGRVTIRRLNGEAACTQRSSPGSKTESPR
jgi:ABC-type ATPase with predicted acetyltransferase domain